MRASRSRSHDKRVGGAEIRVGCPGPNAVADRTLKMRLSGATSGSQHGPLPREFT